MIPIVKDTNGNQGDTQNYRGITISPIASKIFEHVLKNLFASHLTTSHLQFGYKKKNATTHAVHCLKETIDFYINHGSNVYCSFLDASKAFDRLTHGGLFLKLMNKGAPNSILRVDGRSDDLVMLRLIESHCISILSYAVEVIHIADRKLKSKMRVAYNSVFRKLFNFSWRESVTDLQHALGRPTWEELIAERRSNFLFKISLLPTNCLTRAFIS